MSTEHRIDLAILAITQLLRLMERCRARGGDPDTLRQIARDARAIALGAETLADELEVTDHG